MDVAAAPVLETVDPKLKISDNRPSSPNTICAICLGQLKRQCHTNACKHKFCFECLLEWSRVKYECPLCKINFCSIERISEGIHETFLLTPRETPPEQPAEPLTVFTANDTSNTLFRGSTMRFRRFIYRRGLRAHLEGNFRNCPRLFLNQPSQICRLRPWLEREMRALIPSRWQEASTAISNALQLYPMDNPFFLALVAGFTGRSAPHFKYELGLFASSYYDMHAWDTYAEYELSESSFAVIFGQMNHNEYEEIEIIDNPPPPVVPVVSATPEVITLSDTEMDFTNNSGANDVIEIIELDNNNSALDAPPTSSTHTTDVTIQLDPSTSAGPSSSSTDESEPGSRRRRHSRGNKRRRVSYESNYSSTESNSESEVEESHRRQRSRQKRQKMKPKTKPRLLRHRRSRRESTSDESDYFPIHPRYQSLRSVVVVPSPSRS